MSDAAGTSDTRSTLIKESVVKRQKKNNGAVANAKVATLAIGKSDRRPPARLPSNCVGYAASSPIDAPSTPTIKSEEEGQERKESAAIKSASPAMDFKNIPNAEPATGSGLSEAPYTPEVA
ncbi:MAG: hypothetical protein Q9166_004877 [cf. Caloplaca sp. 2 TL-2023]